MDRQLITITPDAVSRRDFVCTPDAISTCIDAVIPLAAPRGLEGHGYRSDARQQCLQNPLGCLVSRAVIVSFV
jgi:hypothetical protein